jgi:hypothetical protein
LGRFDGDSMREHLSALRSITGAVEELDSGDLRSEIDRTAVLGEIRSSLYRWQYEQPHVRNPAFWLSHLFQALYSLLTRHDSDVAARAPAVLSRLQSAPDFLSAARSTINRPPSVFVDTALNMLGGGGELIAQVVGLFGQRAPGMIESLQQAGEAALKALVGFGTALRNEIEPDPDPNAFAIGETQFSRRLHHEHAIQSGPAVLARYGVQLQEEVTRQITELAARLSPKPWRELVDELREDAPPADQLLGTYRAEAERAESFLESHGLIEIPNGELEVVPTPAYLTSLVPFAAYEPPPVYLAQRTGTFYVTAPDPKLPPEAFAEQRRAHSRHGIPVLVAHEVFPGHHLQLLTMEGLPSEARRHLWTPVMVEGWALYAEQLMADTGYYPSDESRLFQLVTLLWRAIRIVLDVGLQTRGMSPSAATDYLVEHMPMERRNAEAEVRRYCAMPTYQLCYAVGYRELLSLREAYRQRHGSEYSLKQFHTELMHYGGLPVALARWGMDLAE